MVDIVLYLIILNMSTKLLGVVAIQCHSQWNQSSLYLCSTGLMQLASVWSRSFNLWTFGFLFLELLVYLCLLVPNSIIGCILGQYMTNGCDYSVSFMVVPCDSVLSP
jgi:hypothetical protein